MKKISTFKERLRLAISIRGYSQKELSELTEISKSLISRYLRGDFEANGRRLYSLSQALRVSPTWLMGLDTEMEEKKDDSTPPSNNKYIDDIISILNKQDNETLERILSMIKLMIK